MCEQKLSSSDGYKVLLDELIQREGRHYRRILMHTPWFHGPFDLVAAFRAGLGDNLTSDGTAFVSEKVAIVAAGRTVDARTLKVSKFARFISKFARPSVGNLAQSIPERTQYIINRIGYPRILLACAAAALTRPFKIKGAFFLVAGREARDLDGMHPPYDHTLLPPFNPREAQSLVNDLADRLNSPVAIVDINDFGGHIRAISPGGLPAKDLLLALKDNPMGHASQSTPIGMIAKSIPPSYGPKS